MVLQTPQIDLAANGTRAWVHFEGISDPNIHFESLADDYGIWVFVQDKRTGIAAENQGLANGTAVVLNMGKAGTFSLYCTMGKPSWPLNPPKQN